MVAIDSDPTLTKGDKAQQKQNLYMAYNLNGALSSHSLAPTVSPLSNSFYGNDTIESVVGEYWKSMYFFQMYYSRHRKFITSDTLQLQKNVRAMSDAGVFFRNCVRRVNFRRPN